jgi:Meckel syndrome type 1 protein
MAHDSPTQDTREARTTGGDRYATHVAPYLYLPKLIRLVAQGSLTAGRPAGTVVGTLEASFPTSGIPVEFSLVPSPDSVLFWVDGDSLRTSRPYVNTRPLDVNFRIRAVDRINGSLDQVFSLTIWPSDTPPTDVGLSSDGVEANAAPGLVVATIWTTDPNVGVTHIYEMLSGGDVFAVEENRLVTRAPIPQTDSLEVRIRSRNSLGQTCERSFTLVVWQPPTELAPPAPLDLPTQTISAAAETLEPELVESLAGTVLLGLNPRVLRNIANQKTARISGARTLRRPPPEQVGGEAAPEFVERAAIELLPDAEFIDAGLSPTAPSQPVPDLEQAALERVQVFPVLGTDPSSHEVIRLGEMVAGTEATCPVEPIGVDRADTGAEPAIVESTARQLAAPPGILKSNTVIRVRGSNKVRSDVRATETLDPLPGMLFAETVSERPAAPLELPPPVAAPPPLAVEAVPEMEFVPEEEPLATLLEPAAELLEEPVLAPEAPPVEAPPEAAFIPEDEPVLAELGEAPPPLAQPVALEVAAPPAITAPAEFVPEEEPVLADLDEAPPLTQPVAVEAPPAVVAPAEAEFLAEDDYVVAELDEAPPVVEEVPPAPAAVEDIAAAALLADEDIVVAAVDEQPAPPQLDGAVAPEAKPIAPPAKKVEAPPTPKAPAPPAPPLDDANELPFEPKVITVNVTDAAADWSAYLPPVMRQPQASPSDQLFSHFQKAEPGSALDPSLWLPAPTADEAAKVRERIDQDLFVAEEPGTGAWGLTALGGFAALHGRKPKPESDDKSTDR